MPKLITLRLFSLFVWLVPPMFLFLKYCEIQADHRVEGSQEQASISDLVLRRLDNPSFWAIFASAIAALLILHGIAKINMLKKPWSQTVTKKYGKWRLIVAITLSTGYLLVTGLKSEALFFALGKGPEHHDTQIILIQLIEGILNLASIWIMARFFWVALVGIEQLKLLNLKSSNGQADALPPHLYLHWPIQRRI